MDKKVRFVMITLLAALLLGLLLLVACGGGGVDPYGPGADITATYGAQQLQEQFAALTATAVDK